MSTAFLPRRAVCYLSLSAVVMVALLGGCSNPETSGGTPGDGRGAMPVTVLEMAPRTIPTTITVMAQTEGAREAEVRPRVSGILLKRLYQEGETVQAGQPLFQIDRTSYEIALAEAKARADQAAREVKRLKGLLASKSVSRKTYDDAISNQEIALAALRQAQLNLSWTTVTAPVSGTTGRAMTSEGSLISTGADVLLTSVYQLDPIWVRFSLADSDMAKLPHGRLAPESISAIELVLPDGSVFPQKGKVNFVASTIDPMLGTRQLRAEFRNPDNHLLPGQFVRARLLLSEREGVFLVPQVAVMQTDKGHVVMTVNEENKVAPRPVQAAEWQGQDWVIIGGLQPGDKVIIDNLIKLRPGMSVAPMPQVSEPATGSRN